MEVSEAYPSMSAMNFMAAMWAFMFLWECEGGKWVAKRINVAWHMGNVGMLVIVQNDE